MHNEFSFNEDEEKKIYTKYKYIIPFVILGFLFNEFFRDYSYCKIKWFLDYKYISNLKFLIWYGLVGAIFCFIFSIISSNVKCTVNNKDNEEIFCKKKENSTIYYYDSFSIYFNDLFRSKRKRFINALYFLLFLISIILAFLVKLFSIIIIQNLNPAFYICSISIYYFVNLILKYALKIEILSEAFTKKNIFINLAELTNILGIIYYLELIEFNFCGLNYNMKKNILIRSRLESTIIKMDEEEGEEGDQMEDN